ncbi:flagellar motor protein MotB [Pseudohongiella sp. O18]|uniref:OmpA/MotB family protein n=1 Tax=Pseudohongiella sp. O18 TaxID=2904248 RepID=UPI001F35F83C|nr:OmpA family protein [Pseudohongiella sp. O18]
MEMSRYSVDQVGDDGAPPEQDNSWMLSYLDVLTLLIAFFVLLLAMSEPKTEEEPVLQTLVTSGAPGADGLVTGSTSTNPNQITSVQAATDGVLTGGIGVLPEYNAIIAGNSGETNPDADATGTNDQSIEDYEERYGDLQDSLNALSLQGVDATPGTEGLTLRIADNLLFDSGEAELRYEGMILISQLTEVLEAFSGDISVEGHTDNIPISTPRFPSNWELSSARAISVLRFLESDGIDPSRMRAIGYADTQPLQSNASAEGRAGNRRVELVLRES